MANSFSYQDQRINVGDRIAVHQKIEEEGKVRIQVFEGVVIAIKNRNPGQTFTVRKIAVGAIGVERIIPVNSPSIEKIEVKSRGSVRRAKLYYLRDRSGKLALRVKEKKTIVTKKPTKKPVTPKPKSKPAPPAPKPSK